MLFDTLVEYLTKLFFAYEEVYLVFHEVFFFGSVNIAEVLRYGLVEYYSADSCVNENGSFLAVPFTLTANFYFSVKAYSFGLISHDSFVCITEYLAFTEFAVLVESKVI